MWNASFIYPVVKGFSIFWNFWLCWVFVAAHGPSLVVAQRGFFSCGVRLLLLWRACCRACWPSSWGAWAQLPVVWDLSSPTRDRTWVPCTGRQILNHWPTRKVSWMVFLKIKFWKSLVKLIFQSLQVEGWISTPFGNILYWVYMYGAFFRYQRPSEIQSRNPCL